MIIWDDPDKRYYQHGLDRGVLYPSKIPPADLVATNLALNPAAAVLTGNTWGGSAGTGGVATQEDFPNGGWSNLPYHKMTWTTAPASGNARIQANPITIPVVAGKIMSFGLWGLSNAAKGCRLSIDFYNGPTFVQNLQSTAPVTANPNVWEQYKREGLVVPPTATTARVYFSRGTAASVVAGEFIAATGLVVVEGPTLPPFFYGDSPDDLYEYSWSGAPNNSTSLKKLIKGRAVAFNGLISFDEGADGGETAMYYRDGVVYLADVEPSDFVGKLSAISYPSEFAECIGIPQLTDGFYADNQKPIPFGFSYRTLVGSGSRGDMFGYQIHLVYGAMATIGQRSRRTIGADTTPVEFVFDIVCTPVKLSGYRPTAHYIIDTRNMSSSVIASLEAILYGSDSSAPRLPNPQELFDIMNFGDAITVTVHTDGTYTVVASQDNLEEIGPYSFVMRNINGVDNGDGTYDISDGGNTDVIIE